MAIPQHPTRRPGLAVQPDGDVPGSFVLRDQLHVSPTPLSISRFELEMLERMTGRLNMSELILAAAQADGGVPMPTADATAFVARLDEGLYLDSPRLDDYLAGPVREPAHIGCYPGDPVELRTMFADLFTMPGGPGHPGSVPKHNQLRGALVPHIDYGRGDLSYVYGFKEIFERTTASLFVVIATAHYSAARFTLTRKNFKSPLGIVPTDQPYIDRLVKHYGDGLFDDPYAHFPEHSIELELVMLQYLYENVRPFRIVPLLVGSFADSVEFETSPREQPDIARMIAALKQVEAETEEDVCYIVSGDLAHIGPKFGDPPFLSDEKLEDSRVNDLDLLQFAAAGDAESYFRLVAGEGDQRRICGLPPTYIFLEAVQPTRGKLLQYGQYVHPEGFESVSFASVGFYR